MCLDGDCLRNLIAVCAAAGGGNTPTEENRTFNHNSSELAALNLAFAMPLAVFMCLFLCASRMGTAHPRVLLSGNECGTVCVGVGVGKGAGLAVSVLMVAQWWHLSARFFRLVSRLTSCFLALLRGGLKVPH